jgi:hypothetical protein
MKKALKMRMKTKRELALSSLTWRKSTELAWAQALCT